MLDEKLAYQELEEALKAVHEKIEKGQLSVVNDNGLMDGLETLKLIAKVQSALIKVGVIK